MQSEAPRSGVGRVIADRYRLLHRLGSGGMGQVWLAHDRRLDCEVALKEVVFGGPDEAEQERTARVARARAEARHAAGLRAHPNVVTVHDVLEHDALPWIVMEYVPGALDLKALVDRHGALAPAECARIGVAVLDEPRPMLRAGALEAVLTAMLAKDPALRITAADAEAALSAIVTPGTRPRPGPVPGPRPRWAHAPVASAPEGHALPRPAPGTPWHAPSDEPGGQDDWSPPEHRSSGGPQPVPPPRTTGDLPGAGGRVHRHRLRALLAGLATALGLALVVAGAWQAVENLRDLRGALDGSADTLSTELPYGRAVGLVEPLRDGDCVDVTWAGTPFEDAARLRVVPACAGRAMDGQVMASYEASSAEDARAGGAARCEQLTEEAREKLVDVRAFAVLPTAEGFDAAGHRVACLLLGERRPVYGPIGAYRTVGETVLVDVATLQKQDCLDPVSSNRIRLVSCHDRHRQKVLGFYEMSPGTTYDAAQDQALAACVRNLPPRQYGHEPGITASGFWISEDGWEKGAHFVVCTVISGSGGTMEGEEA
jgi:hypothetical protein